MNGTTTIPATYDGGNALQGGLSQEDLSRVVTAFASAQDVRQSSRKVYARAVSAFFRWVQDRGASVNSLTVSDIIAYKDELLKEGRSALTVAGQINAIRRFYDWTEASKIYPNIARGCHAPKRKADEFRHKPLSVAKVGELLRYARENLTRRDYAIISLMVYTGLRCVEVVRANVEDITYIGEDNARVLMVQGKGHDSKDDWVRLTDAAFAPVQDYLSMRRGESPKAPLFASVSNHTGKESCHPTEGDFNPRRLSTRSVSSICKNALRAVGLDSRLFTAHSLRHTAGTNILRAGGTLEQAQQTLRHSNPATTQIYVKMALKERRLKNGGETLLENFYKSVWA